MKINDIYEVKIIDEDDNGNGVARIDGFVTFIYNALKDEKLKIKITSINKHYARGIILDYIEESNKRIKPVCKYYESCGGCNFLHTTYSNEMDIKLRYLEKLFNRKINLIENINIYNYRNKVILHVLNGKLGLYEDETHNLCEIDSCMLLDDKINLKISELNKYDLNGINEILIRLINNQIMIKILGENINKNIFNIDCDSLYYNDKLIKGESYLINDVNGYKFSISPDSFFQVNIEGMTNIYNKALEYAGKDNSLLDLYCGTGTIGIWLSNNFNKILGCEVNESSIKNANINKELNNIKNISFICNDAKNIKGNFDVIVVDPPRSGLYKDVINFLNNSKSKRIVYVSCNPKTLKRDIDSLTNYELKDISCTSMFPRTKHIESVVLLERIVK